MELSAWSSVLRETARQARTRCCTVRQCGCCDATCGSVLPRAQSFAHCQERGTLIERGRVRLLQIIGACEERLDRVAADNVALRAALLTHEQRAACVIATSDSSSMTDPVIVPAAPPRPPPAPRLCTCGGVMTGEPKSASVAVPSAGMGAAVASAAVAVSVESASGDEVAQPPAAAAAATSVSEGTETGGDVTADSGMQATPESVTLAAAHVALSAHVLAAVEAPPATGAIKDAGAALEAPVRAVAAATPLVAVEATVSPPVAAAAAAAAEADPVPDVTTDVVPGAAPPAAATAASGDGASESDGNNSRSVSPDATAAASARADNAARRAYLMRLAIRRKLTPNVRQKVVVTSDMGAQTDESCLQDGRASSEAHTDLLLSVGMGSGSQTDPWFADSAESGSQTDDTWAAAAAGDDASASAAGGAASDAGRGAAGRHARLFPSSTSSLELHDDGADDGSDGAAIVRSGGGAADATRRGHQRKSMLPPAWQKYLSFAAVDERSRVVMSPKAFQVMCLSILMDKIGADKIDLREGTPYAGLSEHSIQFILFKWGSTEVARTRLLSFIAVIKALKATNSLAALFARFVGLLGTAPPTEVLVSLLMAIDVGLAGARPSLNATSRDVSVCVSVANACNGIRHAATIVPFVDVSTSAAAVYVLAHRDSGVPDATAIDPHMEISVVRICELFLGMWDVAALRITAEFLKAMGCAASVRARGNGERRAST